MKSLNKKEKTFLDIIFALIFLILAFFFVIWMFKETPKPNNNLSTPIVTTHDINYEYIKNPKDFLKTIKPSDISRSNPKYQDEYRYTSAIEQEVSALIPDLVSNPRVVLATENPYLRVDMKFLINFNKDDIDTLRDEVFLITNALKLKFPHIPFGNISVNFSADQDVKGYSIDVIVDYDKATKLKKEEILKKGIFKDPSWIGSEIYTSYYNFCAKYDQLRRKNPQIEFCSPFME